MSIGTASSYGPVRGSRLQSAEARGAAAPYSQGAARDARASDGGSWRATAALGDLVASPFLTIAGGVRVIAGFATWPLRSLVTLGQKPAVQPQLPPQSPSRVCRRRDSDLVPATPGLWPLGTQFTPVPRSRLQSVGGDPFHLGDAGKDNANPDAPAESVDEPPQTEEVRTTEDFWRVQVEAIYRKRNPYKLKSVPEFLARYKGQEVALYVKVCKTYDLDPAKFYADPAAWGDEWDDDCDVNQSGSQGLRRLLSGFAGWGGRSNAGCAAAGPVADGTHDGLISSTQRRSSAGARSRPVPAPSANAAATAGASASAAALNDVGGTSGTRENPFAFNFSDGSAVFGKFETCQGPAGADVGNGARRRSPYASMVAGSLATARACHEPGHPDWQPVWEADQRKAATAPRPR